MWAKENVKWGGFALFKFSFVPSATDRLHVFEAYSIFSWFAGLKIFATLVHSIVSRLRRLDPTLITIFQRSGSLSSLINRFVSRRRDWLWNLPWRWLLIDSWVVRHSDVKTHWWMDKWWCETLWNHFSLFTIILISWPILQDISTSYWKLSLNNTMQSVVTTQWHTPLHNKLCFHSWHETLWPFGMVHSRREFYSWRRRRVRCFPPIRPRRGRREVSLLLEPLCGVVSMRLVRRRIAICGRGRKISRCCRHDVSLRIIRQSVIRALSSWRRSRGSMSVLIVCLYIRICSAQSHEFVRCRTVRFIVLKAFILSQRNTGFVLPVCHHFLRARQCTLRWKYWNGASCTYQRV